MSILSVFFFTIFYVRNKNRETRRRREQRQLSRRNNQAIRYSKSFCFFITPYTSKLRLITNLGIVKFPIKRMGSNKKRI